MANALSRAATFLRNPGNANPNGPMTDTNEHATVKLGSRVRIREADSAEVETFHVVPPAEVDVLANKIPPNSPMAQALLGSKPGDTVEYEAPAGAIELHVVDVADD
jgi:transcription elongation GreA/GreB family factor